MFAVDHEKHNGIEVLLCIHNISDSILQKAIKIAIEKKDINSINVLLKYGAKMDDDYADKLYSTYQFKVNKHTDIGLLQLSSLYEHDGIYQFILNKEKYKEELQKQEYPNEDINLSIRLLRSDKNAKPSSLFNFYQSPNKILVSACILGDLKIIERTIKKYNLDVSKMDPSPLDIAAIQGHKDVVIFFIKNLTSHKIDELLLNAVTRKMYDVAASLLEALDSNTLNKAFLNKLADYSSEIRDAYHAILLKQVDINHEETLKRQAEVAQDKNELGIFLHQLVVDKKKSI